jgi:hypothetical protein
VLPLAVADNSWQAGFAVPDLFIEGSQLGVYYADLFNGLGYRYKLTNDPYLFEGLLL